MPTLLKLLTNGGDRTGVAINSTGIFLDFETTYKTKASYLAVQNLGAYPVLVNFNSTAIDATADDDKSIVIAPGGSIDFADEEISNATIFCVSSDTSTVNYVMGKRNYMRGGS